MFWSLGLEMVAEMVLSKRRGHRALRSPEKERVSGAMKHLTTVLMRACVEVSNTKPGSAVLLVMLASAAPTLFRGLSGWGPTPPLKKWGGHSHSLSDFSGAGK